MQRRTAVLVLLVAGLMTLAARAHAQSASSTDRWFAAGGGIAMPIAPAEEQPLLPDVRVRVQITRHVGIDASALLVTGQPRGIGGVYEIQIRAQSNLRRGWGAFIHGGVAGLFERVTAAPRVPTASGEHTGHRARSRSRISGPRGGAAGAGAHRKLTDRAWLEIGSQVMFIPGGGLLEGFARVMVPFGPAHPSRRP